MYQAYSSGFGRQSTGGMQTGLLDGSKPDRAMLWWTALPDMCGSSGGHSRTGQEEVCSYFQGISEINVAITKLPCYLLHSSVTKNYMPIKGKKVSWSRCSVVCL